MCARSLMSVCVFYDSECIPFELHAIYMCAVFIFFLNGAVPCVCGQIFVYGWTVFLECATVFLTLFLGLTSQIGLESRNVFFSFISTI